MGTVLAVFIAIALEAQVGVAGATGPGRQAPNPAPSAGPSTSVPCPASLHFGPVLATPTAGGTVSIDYLNVAPPIEGTWDIESGSDGRMWFSGGNQSDVGRITTSGTDLQGFTVPGEQTGPALTGGPGGNMWYGGGDIFSPGTVGKIDTSGRVTRVTSALSAGANDIVAGSDGNLWVPEVFTDKMARITPSGTVTEFAVSGDPYFDALGPDGDVWFTEKESGVVGCITPQGSVSEYPVPNRSSLPEGITAGPHAIWITERQVGRLLKISMSGAVSQYQLPRRFAATTPDYSGGPLGVTLDGSGNVWFGIHSTSTLGRMTPAGIVTEFSVPQHRILDPLSLARGPDGRIWFTTGGGSLGVIRHVRNDCTITGTDGPDFLKGTSGKDVICALAGNDVVSATAGGDVVIGGAGMDKIRYLKTSPAVSVNLGTQVATQGSQRARLISIERVSGTGGPDHLVGNFAANRLAGRGGVDRLAGGFGSDQLIGGRNNDRLNGGGGSDRLLGGRGSDRMVVANYTDDAYGGKGGDLFLLGNDPYLESENVFGGRGTDTVDYRGKHDFQRLIVDLAAATARKAVPGFAVVDQLRNVENVIGSDGNDVLRGSSDGNLLRGLGGNDVIKGRGRSDRLLGGPGSDHIYGGRASDYLLGGVDHDYLYGGRGTDVCRDSSDAQSSC